MIFKYIKNFFYNIYININYFFLILKRVYKIKYIIIFESIICNIYNKNIKYNILNIFKLFLFNS